MRPSTIACQSPAASVRDGGKDIRDTGLEQGARHLEGHPGRRPEADLQEGPSIGGDDLIGHRPHVVASHERERRRLHPPRRPQRSRQLPHVEAWIFEHASTVLDLTGTDRAASLQAAGPDLHSRRGLRERRRGVAGAPDRRARGGAPLRRTFRNVPSPPRCKLCYAPFRGIGGLVLRPWFGPWERNSQLCKSCVKTLAERGVGGAEVELSLLFADIRGSTGLGERLRPAEFSAPLMPSIGSPRRRSSRPTASSTSSSATRRSASSSRAFPGRSTRRGRSRPVARSWRPPAAASASPNGPDPGRGRRPHRDRLCREPWLERADLGLHGARRPGEHDRAAGLAGDGRRAARVGGGGRTTPGSMGPGSSDGRSRCAVGRPGSMCTRSV